MASSEPNPRLTLDLKDEIKALNKLAQSMNLRPGTVAKQLIRKGLGMPAMGLPDLEDLDLQPDEQEQEEPTLDR